MKTPFLRLALLLLAAAVAASGCGKKKNADAPDSRAAAAGASDDSGDGDNGMPSARELNEAAANLKKSAPFVGKEVGDAMQAMGKVMAQSENVTINPVDFRTLRDLLPETAGALKRKSREGQKQMGMSEATAEYGDDEGNASISLKITDSGQMRALMAGGMAAALSMDVDKETENGYERTATFQGFRIREQKTGNNVELTTLVGDRFLVEMRGDGVQPEQLKALLGELPLKKLEAMKDEGVEKAK